MKIATIEELEAFIKEHGYNPITFPKGAAVVVDKELLAKIKNPKIDYLKKKGRSHERFGTPQTRT